MYPISPLNVKPKSPTFIRKKMKEQLNKKPLVGKTLPL